MKFMRVKYGFRYPDVNVEPGTILAIEDKPNTDIVFILEGEFANRSVHLDHLEDIDLGQLLEDLRIAQDNEKRAVAAVDRMAGYISERDEYKVKLAIAREGMQVILPREVAEAIEYISAFSTPFVLHRFNELSEKYTELRDPLKVIDEYVFMGNLN